jgi:hypothetical protein
MAQAEARRPRVELFYFDGCPHWTAAQMLVERVSAEMGADVKLVKIAGPDEAMRERFLGSPSIRVDGHDIEPGTDTRTDYAFSCRLYRTETGTSGQPDDGWLRAALRRPGAG